MNKFLTTGKPMQANLADLSFVGEGLARPECVVCTRAGDLFVSDRRGGISYLPSGGGPPVLLKAHGRDVPEGFMPNGFALCPDRSFLIANLGPTGGVYRMTITGELTPFLLEIDGQPLPPINFVNRDREGGVWISVSIRKMPREEAFRRDTADGFIIYAGSDGVRIVADSIGFSNENKHDASGRWLYVNETMARRLSRFAVVGAGQLGPRETVVEFSNGIFPDGLDFDADGGIWIASVVSNRLVRIGPDGVQTVVLDDSDPEAVAAAEAAFAHDEFGREHIDAGKAGVLGNLASVTFGGPELDTLYLGSLFSDRIATLPSPVSGLAPAHWEY